VNETSDDELREHVIAALRRVNDPETNMNVYDMDLISDLKVLDGSVALVFTPSSFICPLAIQLSLNIRRSISAIEGVRSARVRVANYAEEEKLNEMLGRDNSRPD
jgi:metal-sulfur cluster biosynthetic enzyme